MSAAKKKINAPKAAARVQTPSRAEIEADRLLHLQEVVDATNGVNCNIHDAIALAACLEARLNDKRAASDMLCYAASALRRVLAEIGPQMQDIHDDVEQIAWGMEGKAKGAAT